MLGAKSITSSRTGSNAVTWAASRYNSPRTTCACVTDSPSETFAALWQTVGLLASRRLPSGLVRSAWIRDKLRQAALGAEPKAPEEWLDRALLSAVRGDRPAAVAYFRRFHFKAW